jgi:hypothetical protein
MRCDAMRCDAMRCDAMRCEAKRSVIVRIVCFLWVVQTARSTVCVCVNGSINHYPYIHTYIHTYILLFIAVLTLYYILKEDDWLSTEPST